MLFLNPWLLLTLAGVSIPVILHLVRRQAAKPVDWGAMRFLHDTLSERRRRMEWEDLLLMAARCLLLALAGLAIARPFVPPDSRVPWLFVLPLALLVIAVFGASFVLASTRLRRLLRLGAVVLASIAAGLVFSEHLLHLKRFESSGRRDVAIIIDASSSMTRETVAASVFEQAREEAKRIVGKAPRGTSFVIVSGGPSPRALTSTPLTHRADVLEQLAALKPVGGTFRAHEALGIATLALAEGNNSAKQIVVITDGQRHGWRFGDAGAWQSLEDAWNSLPQKPKLLLRRIATGESLRNAGIAEVVCKRRLVGTDRPSVVRVRVENTGTEPVTPGAVTLEIEDKQVGSEALGMLVPGQTETVEFTHKFATEGPQALVVIVGPRSDTTFYNQWSVSDGPLMPLELVKETGDEQGVFPAPATFQHESLALFRDEAASDIGQAVIQRWCKAETRSGPGVVGAGFSNGDPFLAGRLYGRGNKRAVIERIDPGVDFQWGSGSPGRRLPAENFSAVWRGGLVAPFDGEYQLEAEVDDEVTMTVGGRTVLSTSLHQPRTGRVSLKAGRAVPVEIRYREDSGDAYVRLFWTPEGGVRSVIPPSAWLPVGESSGEWFAALDPLGQTRRANVSTGRRGRELRIEGEAVPGLYRVDLPETLRDAIPTLGEVQKLPVVVRRDIDESRLDMSTEEDLEEIRGRIVTFLPETSDDVLAVVSGRGFGREITRMIAIAALVFLVLETALGRWVSKSRRAGEVENIDFGADEPLPFGRGGGR